MKQCLLKNEKVTAENLKRMVIPILQSYNVDRAGLFGSYVKNEYTEKSDVDILIQLGEKISLLEFVRT